MPTRQSFTVEMVGREDVANAVAHTSAIFNGARVIGPAVAGLTIGLVGIAACFLLNGLSFLAVIAGLAPDARLELHVGRHGRLARRSVGAVFENLGEGLALCAPHADRPPARSRRSGSCDVRDQLESVRAADGHRTSLHVDAAGYGFLMAAAGVGA